jgi:hypothetical protein
MTNYSRIDMAFEIYKSMVSNGRDWGFHFEGIQDYDRACEKMAKISFMLADTFTKEVKNNIKE